MRLRFYPVLPHGTARLLAGLVSVSLAALTGCKSAAPPSAAPPSAESAQVARAKVTATVSEPRLVTKVAAHPAPVQEKGLATPKPAPPPPVPAPVPQGPTHAGAAHKWHYDAGKIAGTVHAPGTAPTPVTAMPIPQQVESATAPDQTSTLLKTYKEALRAGFIDYNPPGLMTVGASETIVVRLRRGALPATAPGLPTSPGGSTSTQQLSLYPQMRVTLDTNSGGAFQIAQSAATPTSQVVPDDGYAEWRWTVSPLLSGPDKTLVVTAWADLGTKDGVPQTILVAEYQAIINVQVAPAPPPPTAGQRIGKFIADNWKWLWTALLVPLAGWLIPRLSRKKKDGE
jgi:hypothetical protein